MARCPFAAWRPLAKTQPPAIARHDLVICHTMGGNSLQGTDTYFRQGGYTGDESHFGVGYDGTIYQWVDTDHQADANLDANDRAISIETADAGHGFTPWSGSNVPAWTDAQLGALVRLIAWICDTHNIPKAMVPDSATSRRGIGGHRQGIDSSPAGQPGYRKPGTEHWSNNLGKVCPGDRRFAQLKATVVPAVASGGDDVITQADLDNLAHAVWAYDQSGAKAQAWSYLQNAANADASTEAIAAAVVAALPPASTGGLTQDDVKAALVDVLTNGINGGTS